MLSAVRGADRLLFVKINSVWTCRALDLLLPALTDANRSPWFWAGLAGVAALWLYRDRARAALVIAALGLTVGASDLLCFRLVKPLVRRLRPEYVLSGVILRAGRHGRYGFPSNHSANAFAAAAFVSSFYPRLSWPLFALAGAIAYSRVYVGAHFPADVLGGAVIGFGLGRLAALGLKRAILSLTKKGSRRYSSQRTISNP